MQTRKRGRRKRQKNRRWNRGKWEKRDGKRVNITKRERGNCEGMREGWNTRGTWWPRVNPRGVYLRVRSHSAHVCRGSFNWELVSATRTTVLRVVLHPVVDKIYERVATTVLPCAPANGWFIFSPRGGFLSRREFVGSFPSFVPDPVCPRFPRIETTIF